MPKLLSFVIWTLSFVWHLSFFICHCPRKEIATLRQVRVHNDKEAILSMQASSPEGHSTIFYSKTVLIGDSHEPGWLVC